MPSSVEWSWVCKKLELCGEENNTFTILGNGTWKCSKRRAGRTTICKAVCADGRNAYNGNTKDAVFYSRDYVQNLASYRFNVD